MVAIRMARMADPCGYAVPNIGETQRAAREGLLHIAQPPLKAHPTFHAKIHYHNMCN
jgi:hypothetical protein